MKSIILIGLFSRSGPPVVYRDPESLVPQFTTYPAAERYIAALGLGNQASPIEITEVEEGRIDARLHEATDP